jgi:hypothetical protein
MNVDSNTGMLRMRDGEYIVYFTEWRKSRY